MNGTIGAFVATAKPEHARSCYRVTLGLKLVSEDPFALVFDGGGTVLRVRTSGRSRRIRHRRRLERAHPMKPGVAWFEDPDGNTLSLAQSRHSLATAEARPAKS